MTTTEEERVASMETIARRLSGLAWERRLDPVFAKDLKEAVAQISASPVGSFDSEAPPKKNGKKKPREDSDTYIRDMWRKSDERWRRQQEQQLRTQQRDWAAYLVTVYTNRLQEAQAALAQLEGSEG